MVIDKLCYRSKLRYTNAGEKFAFSLITLILCMISRSILIAGIVLATNGVLIVKKGGIPLFQYIKLMRIPVAFLILGTLTIMVNISKTPLNAYAVPVGEYYITGSRNSLLWGAQLIMTALAAVSCLYFLSLNTTMTDILGVLAALHCPPLMIELMLLIYRFSFVLTDIASGIMVSQHSRLGNKDMRTSMSSFGKMAAVLLVRALKKSNALYDSMESRCYDGKVNVLKENYPVKKKEVWAILLYEAVLCGIAVFIKTGWR